MLATGWVVPYRMNSPTRCAHHFSDVKMLCDNAAGDRWHRCTDRNSASHFQCFIGSCFEHGPPRGAGSSSRHRLRCRAEFTVLDGADMASHPPQLPEHDARHQRVWSARCHVYYALCRPRLRVLPAWPLMVRCWAIQKCCFSTNCRVPPLNMICNPQCPWIAGGKPIYENMQSRGIGIISVSIQIFLTASWKISANDEIDPFMIVIIVVSW